MSVGPHYRAALRCHICKVPVEITPEVLRQRAHFYERVGCDRGLDGAKALPDQVAHERKKIGRYRGDVVAPVIRTAEHLTRLRPPVRKTWARQLAAGVNTPVASRYLTFGNSWPGQIGHTPGAEEHGGADRRVTDREAGPGALARTRLGRVEPVSSSRPWRGVPSP